MAPSCLKSQNLKKLCTHTSTGTVKYKDKLSHFYNYENQNYLSIYPSIYVSHA